MPKSNFQVVAQDWEESERGWGVRPDGFSLHLTMEDCKQFREKYWASMPKTHVPDEYSRESGSPVEITVDKATYNKIAKAKRAGDSGIWGEGRSLQSASFKK